MLDKDQALQAIYSAIAHVNATLTTDKRIPASTATVLTGPESSLDSLTLTTLFFEIESRVSSQTSATVDLFSAPFLLDPDVSMTVCGLADWLYGETAAA